MEPVENELASPELSKKYRVTGNKNEFYSHEFNTIEEALSVIEELLHQGYDNAHVSDTDKTDIW